MAADKESDHVPEDIFFSFVGFFENFAVDAGFVFGFLKELLKLEKTLLLVPDKSAVRRSNIVIYKKWKDVVQRAHDLESLIFSQSSYRIMCVELQNLLGGWVIVRAEIHCSVDVFSKKDACDDVKC